MDILLKKDIILRKQLIYLPKFIKIPVEGTINMIIKIH
jgi:hypothetical protein